jgi:hypothetical protein
MEEVSGGYMYHEINIVISLFSILRRQNLVIKNLPGQCSRAMLRRYEEKYTKVCQAKI